MKVTDIKREKRANKLIRKNDIVMVIKGKSKGKTGKVVSINPSKDTLIIEKVNMVKKHQRPTQKLKQGGIIEKEGAIRLDNVMIVDPETQKPSRVRVNITENGKKHRVFVSTGEPVDVKK